MYQKKFIFLQLKLEWTYNTHKMDKEKILFVAHEIAPYVPDTEMSLACRKLPQGIQERGREIRIFMPKFGIINERRNQLHEVIRLSGMNLVINEADHPLIIKVASIQPCRMQVYFIDNEDLFPKKYVLTDKGEDNFEADEKSIFFSKGIVETVKKLGWAPNLIHCQGWFSATFPFLMKHQFCYDPLFVRNFKVVYTIFNDSFTGSINPEFAKKLVSKEVSINDLEAIKDPTWINLTKFAIDHANGIILGSSDICPEIIAYLEESKKPYVPYKEIEAQIPEINDFYTKILES